MQNLLSNLAAQAREGKRKYKRESSGSRRSKRARTFAERQNLPQPSSSRNHDHVTEVSENTSTDTSVTRSYGISDKEEQNENDTLEYLMPQY